MDINIKKLVVGPIGTNCYIASLLDGETLIVDPGDESERIIAELNKIENMKLKYILLTHGHFDHLMGVDGLKKEFPDTKVYIGVDDIELVKDMAGQSKIWGEEIPDIKTELNGIAEKDELIFGKYRIKVIATPGHTIGGVCYLVDNSLFSGDTLFYHTYGRLDLPYSSPKEMGESLSKLLSLDGKIRVYPGHMRETTIEEERKNQFF